MIIFSELKRSEVLVAIIDPVSVIAGEYKNDDGKVTNRSYGLGITPITSRLIPSPFSLGISIAPVAYQFPIFKWKY